MPHKPYKYNGPQITPTSLSLDATAVVTAAATTDGENTPPTVVIDPAYSGGLLSVGGYFLPVAVDLAGLVPDENVTLLYQHADFAVVGQGTAKIMKTKIVVTGTITGNLDDPNSSASFIVGHARNGFKWPASIGVLDITKTEYVKSGASAKANGKTFSGPCWIVRAGRLGEVSFVGIGADSSAKSRISAKRKDIVMDPEIMKWLQAKGKDPETMDETELAELTAEYEAGLEAAKAAAAPPAATSKPAPAPKVEAGATMPDVVAEMRVAAAAEKLRLAKISTIFVGKHPELEAKAITEGWDEVKSELENIKASRPAAPAVHASVPFDGDDQVYEAGLLRASGYKGDMEKDFGEKVLLAADKQFGRNGIGLQELLCIHAEAVLGKSFRRVTLGNGSEVLKAAFSTVSLPGILGNVANKHVLDAYNYGDNVDLEIAANRNVANFHEHTSYRLTTGDKYEEVGPGGELKHGTFSEDSYTNQAVTYGKTFSINRTNIINDDLSVFGTMSKRLGEGAAKKRRDVFWTEFLADAATFFTAALGNYQEGAATALSGTSLGTAEQLFMDQTDDNGDPITAEPKFLLVPTALGATAQELYVSREIRNTTASNKYPTANIYADKYKPLVSRYLGNSAFTGYSALAWYLVSDPNVLALNEYAWLNGVQTPTVEVADADFNTLGIQFRGYHDFGVHKQDYRAAVKSKGSA